MTSVITLAVIWKSYSNNENTIYPNNTDYSDVNSKCVTAVVVFGGISNNTYSKVIITKRKMRNIGLKQKKRRKMRQKKEYKYKLYALPHACTHIRIRVRTH